MKSIEEILLELVAIQSDTGTKLECNIANKLIELIKENEYFSKHPEYYGSYVENDVLQRPVVWALRKGSSDRTIILMGHYDAVEIDSYGVLKEYALQPEKLRTEMLKIPTDDLDLKKDLENDDWMFGRGAADMKAGVAINLHTLFNNNNEEVNILFIGVPDEENMSSGAREAVKLYKILKEKFNLEYKLCIISEPSFRNVEMQDPIAVTCGSSGKILPVIVVKGKLAHAARVMSGLNSGVILSKIIEKIEFNLDFISEDFGLYTQPPTVQILRDLKTSYDVSIPEYSAACFNVLFLKSKNPIEIIGDIKDICKESFNEVKSKYIDTFEALLKVNAVTENMRGNYENKVMELAELESYVAGLKSNFYEFKENMKEELNKKIQIENVTLPEASIFYIKKLIEFSEISQPIIVIGIAPPYYPPVNISYVNENALNYLNTLPDFLNDKYDMKIKNIPYSVAMTDLSYTSCGNKEEERKLMSNLTLSSDVYDINFELLEELNIPTVMIGPASKNVHEIGERVYMPEVTKIIPDIFSEIIKRI